MYKALYGKELLATGIMVDYANVRTYVYGGSSENRRQFMAPYLLHWQAIADAHEAGMTYYDLGGTETSSGSRQGFSRFKDGFNGTAANLPGAYDLPFRRTYRIYRGLRAANLWLRKIMPK